MTVCARRSSAYPLCAAAALIIPITCATSPAHATAFAIETIDQPAGIEGTSLALDAFGNAHVTYQDAAEHFSTPLPVPQSPAGE